MHAQRIIQDLPQTECGAIHAKRRLTLALMVQASCIGHLSLIGISRRLDTATALRHRIKRCDRLLGNLHLSNEKLDVYRAMVKRILIGNPRPAIIIDWSDLSAGLNAVDRFVGEMVAGRSSASRYAIPKTGRNDRGGAPQYGLGEANMRNMRGRVRPL